MSIYFIIYFLFYIKFSFEIETKEKLNIKTYKDNKLFGQNNLNPLLKLDGIEIKYLTDLETIIYYQDDTSENNIFILHPYSIDCTSRIEYNYEPLINRGDVDDGII